ncbi:MAG TPA: ankyrin repeat domain-containing protein [Terriglobia bacterium]|nr:ankyrin repeat domain-containing protein [Terriglobia bacterium]
MTRRITPQTSLDNLKKEAKRWLKELRSANAEARSRFENALPKPPVNPGLRDVQRAVAVEYGFAGWTALKHAIEQRATTGERIDGDKLVDRFLEYACPDHHVRGRPAHRIVRHAAVRILAQHPEIARANLYTAVVCGETEEVERLLRQRPQAAREKSPAGGSDRAAAGDAGDIFKDLSPKDWEPLLHLCFARLPLDRANDNSLEIAQLLLRYGADPNAFFMAGNSRYTPLVGAVGEGEEDRPAHPYRDALVRLLLEHGAEPYDIQVIYNIHFQRKVLWYLKLVYEFSLKAGRKADWEDPEWHMLDMGNYGSGARWHLQIAVQENDLDLARWCLEHGASPNAAPARAETLPQESLYEQAVRAGHSGIAELLVQHGAERVTVAMEGELAFIAACQRLDRDEAKRLLERHPEYLKSSRPILAAVKNDNPDLVELLLDLGLSVDAEFEHKQRPLHLAASHDAVDVARLLIRGGAQIDPVELEWNNTPIDFAVWNEYPRMIGLLGRYSSDVGNLTFVGNVARLRQVLSAQPELAKRNRGDSPLFWLPEDEKKAVEIVELFLTYGADVSLRRDDDGMTAEEVARRRGLTDAAKRLAAGRETGSTEDGAESPEVKKYELLAEDAVAAYTGDAAALKRINESWGRNFSLEDLRAIVWRVSYKVRQAGGSANAFDIAEAQQMIAGARGFGNWEALKKAVAKGLPSPVPAYSIDAKLKTLRVRRLPTDNDWDAILDIMKGQGLTALEGGGLMTDAVLKRFAEIDHVTSLSLGGSRQLSNDGMQVLARMPQLEHLELSEYPGGHLNDRGLEVLRHLPNLRTFNMTWQRGITDVGASNLKFCDKLEVVNLMGTPTGDGAIEALRGKPRLRRLDTGRLVTDAGLAMLHEFPMFKTWQNHPASGNDDDEPTHLLIDGPFTNKGLASLAGLDGVFALDLFWHVTGITSDAFKVLSHLAHLGSLGCDGKLSDDVSMQHIAAVPRLQRLRAQGTVATDKGFIALSRSRSLERFWGRECPNLRGEGFVALSKMPALHALGVSCKKVDDLALSSLPQFPALRELTPIDVLDDGFRHVGGCKRLERLTCMYCRETTDVATEHVANLQLKSYYAGLTQITDRSLEILGRMLTLESIELYETRDITDAGLAYLAGLPRLREVHLSGLPNVTMAGTQVFPAHVAVDYNV